jgi:hypothetical protein
MQSISHVLIIWWKYSRLVHDQVCWFLRSLVRYVTTISFRAYGKQDSFVENFFRLTDAETRNFFCFQFTSRWLALRLDVMAMLVIFVVGLLGKSVTLLAWKSSTMLFIVGVIVADNGGFVDSAYLGLALVYSLQLTGFLQVLHWNVFLPKTDDDWRAAIALFCILKLSDGFFIVDYTCIVGDWKLHDLSRETSILPDSDPRRTSCKWLCLVENLELSISSTLRLNDQ